jgi:hypothetical protein
MCLRTSSSVSIDDFAPALPIVGVQASGESCGDQDVGLNVIVGIRHYLGTEPREIGITLTPARQDGLAAVEAFVDAAARAYEVRSPPSVGRNHAHPCEEIRTVVAAYPAQRARTATLECAPTQWASDEDDRGHPQGRLVDAVQ